MKRAKPSACRKLNFEQNESDQRGGRAVAQHAPIHRGAGVRFTIRNGAVDPASIVYTKAPDMLFEPRDRDALLACELDQTCACSCERFGESGP